MNPKPTLTRRHFIQDSAVAGLAIGLSPALLAADARELMALAKRMASASGPRQPA